MNIIRTPNGNILVDEPNIVLTQAEYDNLTDEEKNNGVSYFITDDSGKSVVDIIGVRDISSIGNTITDAIINLDERTTGISPIKITQSEYNALSKSQKNNGIYYIIDGDDKSIYDEIGTADISEIGTDIKNAILNIELRIKALENK